MIQDSDKTNYSGNKINQKQDKQEIFAHGRHHRNIETEQKNEASVNNKHNDVG